MAAQSRAVCAGNLNSMKMVCDWLLYIVVHCHGVILKYHTHTLLHTLTIRLHRSEYFNLRSNFNQHKQTVLSILTDAIRQKCTTISHILFVLHYISCTGCSVLGSLAEVKCLHMPAKHLHRSTCVFLINLHVYQRKLSFVTHFCALLPANIFSPLRKLREHT